MLSDLYQVFIAVLVGLCFFLVIVIAGMTRTIQRLRSEGRFNAKDRRNLIDSVKYTTRNICVREAIALLRDFLSNYETKLPELYVKNEDGEYEEHELHIVRNQMRSIRKLLQKEMIWEAPETEDIFDQDGTVKQAMDHINQVQQT